MITFEFTKRFVFGLTVFGLATGLLFLIPVALLWLLFDFIVLRCYR